MITMMGKDELIIGTFTERIVHTNEAKTAMQVYTEWCIELGLDPTTSVGSFNADDGQWVFTGTPPNLRGIPFADRFMYSSEAAIGLYDIVPTSTTNTSAAVPNISRMYYTAYYPIVLFSYHWPGLDMRSEDTKYNSGPAGYCIYAKHRHYSGTTGSFYVAIMVTASGMKFYFEQVATGTIPFYATTSDPVAKKWLNQYLIATVFEGTATRTLVALEAKDYVPEGTITIDAGSVPNKSVLCVDCEEPVGTSIEIETMHQGLGWVPRRNGDTLDPGVIQIRVTLRSSDASATPLLKGVWLEEHGVPKDTLLIEMSLFKRFQNCISDLTVNYDSTIGTLYGRGGPVPDFSVAFTPTELEPKLNPHSAQGTVAATLDGQFNMVEILHNSRHDDINLSVNILATVNFIDTTVVNP